jgi:hypothetical protein
MIISIHSASSAQDTSYLEPFITAPHFGQVLRGFDTLPPQEEHSYSSLRKIWVRRIQRADFCRLISVSLSGLSLPSGEIIPYFYEYYITTDHALTQHRFVSIYHRRRLRPALLPNPLCRTAMN